MYVRFVFIPRESVMHDSGHISIPIPIPIPVFYKSLIPILIPGKFRFQPNIILLIPILIPANMWLIPESIPIPESESCITEGSPPLYIFLDSVCPLVHFYIVKPVVKPVASRNFFLLVSH